MAVEIAEGRHATVRFDGKRCIHSRRCVMGAPGAFKANVKGPWIDADAVSVEELMRIAYACPSGAITVERRDGGAPEAPPGANAIVMRENGPLVVHADLTIAGHGAMFRVALCRCGLSHNKPFCDNAHVRGRFRASGEADVRELALKVAELTGPVTITPKPNGPLIVEGRIEVTSGTGRALERVERTVLCRCGNSGSKPFCDGTHKRIGFQAP